MYIDKDLQLSDSQAVTVTAASTETIDNTKPGDAYGHENFLVIQCRETATAAGAATVNFSLETDDNSGFATPKVLFDSGAIAIANITANKDIVKIRMPFGMERYARVKYTVGTGPLTAGKFDAFITKDVEVRF